MSSRRSCGLEREPAAGPLLCLTGASGTGKSTVGTALLPVVADRLRARPAWRNWGESRITEMLDYATWLAARVATVDTTDRALADVVDEVHS